MKIKKGDKVIILSGKDAGKTGKVESVFGKKDKILVGGINIFKKHQKPRGEGRPGGIISIPRPITASKVAIICPKCNQTTRIGYQINGEEKVRICKKCKAQL